MKYKLKKWYPSLPKDWEEGMELGLRNRTLEVAPISSIYTQKWILISEVKNNPEFWEKIEEKDYEILSFKGKQGEEFIRVYKSGTHQFKSVYTACPYREETLLRERDILSVKRLSDGEVFTIGDKVQHWVSLLKRDNRWTIKSIKIVNEKIKIFSGTGFHMNLDEICKRKEPLFQTADGIDIYEGDVYYFISSRWNVLGVVADSTLEKKLRFSTKEKAEEYIEQNKPRYSIVDVRDAFKEVQRLPRNQGVLLSEWIGDIKYQVYEQLEKLNS